MIHSKQLSKIMALIIEYLDTAESSCGDADGLIVLAT